MSVFTSGLSRQLIDQYYLEFLGRRPESENIYTQLAGASPQQLRSALEGSQEFQLRLRQATAQQQQPAPTPAPTPAPMPALTPTPSFTGGLNRQLIDQYYQEFLGRRPEPTVYDQLLGTSPQQLRSALENSAEYKLRLSQVSPQQTPAPTLGQFSQPVPANAPAGGDSRIDPALRPYLIRGLQEAQGLFFGPGPQFFPGQTFVSPSEQTLAALQQQEALARGGQPALQEAQRGFLAGFGPSASAPLFEQLYGAGATQAGADVYGRAAAGQMGISPAQFQQLYGEAAPGAPTALQQAAAGELNVSPAQFQDLYRQAGAGVPSLYGQVAEGGFRNIAMDPTMQTAAGSFLMGSPYQQALIEQSVRPIARQLGEVTLPSIQSALSAAGRYGSGAQQRAIGEAVERASRAAGDVATQIGAGTYAQERGFQEAARQQLAGLSQQDLANRLAAAGAAEQTRQAQLAQQTGIAGQLAGLSSQDIQTRLGAAQSAEQIRQSQLAQQAGLAGQIAGLRGQDIVTQLAGAGGLQSAQQAAFARQATAASGLGAAQESQLGRGFIGAQLAPQIYAQQFLPSQQLGQIGAAREQIAAQPLQEQIARFQFGQQVPYQQLQGFLSSVYGTPMGGSQLQQIPQAQTNQFGQALGGALLGSQVGNLFGGFGGFTGSQIGAGLGGLAGLLM
jgi:hypothetical protein